MLTRYIEAAMARARYEILKDDNTYYGEIPGCRGVYANAPSLKACRAALAATLEDGLFFRIHKHLPIPKIGGIALAVKREKAA
jgi:hypothetical protein